MGSLSASGTVLTKVTNRIRISHNGNFIHRNNTVIDEQTTISNSGVIDTDGLNLAGLLFHPNGSSTTHSSGMSIGDRTAVTSVNRALFTIEGTESGVLEHDVVRHLGIHSSISHRAASGSLGPMVPLTERKVFWIDTDRGATSGLSDWTIFDAQGTPVGASAGVTDIDVTPTGIHGV